MNTTQYAGIDYGLGQANRDKVTGIRNGVISQNEVLQAWADSSEAQYGPPHCPKCGNQADEPSAFGETFSRGEHTDAEENELYTHETHECDDYVCVDCKHFFGAESAFGDEPIGFTYEADGYACECGDSGDIFVCKSPYFTYAQFCSPCAPGACYLANPLDEPNDNNRAYCFRHDWFDGGRAPYPVYSVETGELILPATA